MSKQYPINLGDCDARIISPPYPKENWNYTTSQHYEKKCSKCKCSPQPRCFICDHALSSPKKMGNPILSKRLCFVCGSIYEVVRWDI